MTGSKHLHSMLEIINQTTKRRKLGRYYEYQCQPIMQVIYIFRLVQVLSADISEGLEDSVKKFKSVINCVKIFRSIFNCVE